MGGNEYVFKAVGAVCGSLAAVETYPLHGGYGYALYVFDSGLGEWMAAGDAEDNAVYLSRESAHEAGVKAVWELLS